MDLVQDVLIDINSKFNIDCNPNGHISENDLDLIQDVLKEFDDMSFSQNTIECIKKICIDQDQINNRNIELTLSGAVPETPFIPNSTKHRHPKSNNDQYNNNKKKNNHNNLNFNIFSFASNETQLDIEYDNDDQYDDEDMTQMTQMDIDNENDIYEADGQHFYFDNINGAQLSQSLIGLQLTQTQDMSLSPELTK